MAGEGRNAGALDGRSSPSDRSRPANPHRLGELAELSLRAGVELQAEIAHFVVEPDERGDEHDAATAVQGHKDGVAVDVAGHVSFFAQSLPQTEVSQSLASVCINDFAGVRA